MPETLKIIQLKDSSGDKIYPVTTTKEILINYGEEETLNTKIEEIDNNLTNVTNTANKALKFNRVISPTVANNLFILTNHPQYQNTVYYTSDFKIDDSNGILYAPNFNGNLIGNADTATKATQDANENVIVDTYETKIDANTKFTEAKEYTNTTAATLQTSIDTKLPSTTKYAASSSVGGYATYAEKMNIPRVASAITDIAASLPTRTEAIYFCGSDGETLGCPKTYCIINIKRGDNRRTLLDCYHLQTGDHYINGCMDTDDTTNNPWTGWVLQPNGEVINSINSLLSTFENNLNTHISDTSVHINNTGSVNIIETSTGFDLNVNTPTLSGTYKISIYNQIDGMSNDIDMFIFQFDEKPSGWTDTVYFINDLIRALMNCNDYNILISSTTYGLNGNSRSSGKDAYGGWTFSIGKNIIRLSTQIKGAGSAEPT